MADNWVLAAQTLDHWESTKAGIFAGSDKITPTEHISDMSQKISGMNWGDSKSPPFSVYQQVLGWAPTSVSERRGNNRYGVGFRV